MPKADVVLMAYPETLAYEAHERCRQRAEWEDFYNQELLVASM